MKAMSDLTCWSCGTDYQRAANRGKRNVARVRTFCSEACRRSVPLERRFWEKVDTSAGPDGCWLWMGSHHEYGLVRVDGSNVLAHRVAYELTKGSIPDGSVVMHACDIGLCVNPAHLSIGTQSDNVQDAIRKGRFRPGGRSMVVAA